MNLFVILCLLLSINLCADAYFDYVPKSTCLSHNHCKSQKCELNENRFCGWLSKWNNLLISIQIIFTSVFTQIILKFEKKEPVTGIHVLNVQEMSNVLDTKSVPKETHTLKNVTEKNMKNVFAYRNHGVATRITNVGIMESTENVFMYQDIKEEYVLEVIPLITI